MLVLLVGLFAGNASVTLAEVFPAETRLSGVALAHGLGMVLFGSTAPLAATALVQATGDPCSPAALLIIAAGLALGSAYDLHRLGVV